MKEGAIKEKKGLDFFLKNLVDLLKLLVATAYIDCTAYEATLRRIYDFCAYSNLLRTYSTTCVRKRLIAYVYGLCARGDFVRTIDICARKGT